MLEKQVKEFEAKQKSYLRIYMIMCLTVFLSLSGYIYVKGSQYLALKDGVVKNNEMIEVLQNEVAIEKAAYDTNKESFDETASEIAKKMEKIFPENDNYTTLTKQIDLIEDELNRSNDPFEISNIDYQEDAEADEYSILPLRMNIKSSGKNFTKFLHMIENSGALNGELRLMDISSIRLSFQEADENTNADQMITFSVLINAYFQK